MRRLPNEREIPYYRRTPVISVELDPRCFGNVVVMDAAHNVGSMSIASFEALCRPAPGAVIMGIPVGW